MSTYFQTQATATIKWCAGLPYLMPHKYPLFPEEHPIEDAYEVFIEGNQLIQRWTSLDATCSTTFVIGETDFGCGLHFLLVWSLWKKHAPTSSSLRMISATSAPLTVADLKQSLALFPDLQAEALQLIAQYPILMPGYHLLQFDEGRVQLILMIGDTLEAYRELLACGDPVLEKKLRDYEVNAWFLNSCDSGIYTESFFTVMGMLSSSHTTLATPIVSTVMYKAIEIAGFSVLESSTKHILRANYTQLPLGRSPKLSPWHRPYSKKDQRKSAIVLGAGLAGCYIAAALARRGFSVTLLDQHHAVGQGASGNRQAILYPKLSAFYSPLNAFMLNAYLFAIRYYKALLKTHPIGNLSGMLQLAHDHKEQTVQKHLKAWLAQYPDLGRLISAEEASGMAGIPLTCDALFLPHSGWIDSVSLCEVLIRSKPIACELNTLVESLVYEQGEWHVNEYHAPVLVLANGYQANGFTQTHHLPLKPIRGQMTQLCVNEQSERLKLPLCAGAHIIPAIEGLHRLGATYHPGVVDTMCSLSDDELNLAKLQALPTCIDWSNEVGNHWAGIRAATPDYLPLVGPVAEVQDFKNCFAGLATNSKRWIPASANHYDGLYVCTGFGSRGLTTIPLSADSLAALINKEPVALSQSMLRAISPSRFLRKGIISKS